MRMRALDGWRGFASVGVCLIHLQLNGYLTSAPSLESWTMAVDFFFVLSGFVMARVYADGLVDDDNVAKFIVRRVGRLWPLHVSMLALFVIVECLKLALVGRSGLYHRTCSLRSGSGAVGHPADRTVPADGTVGPTSPGTFQAGASRRRCGPTRSSLWWRCGRPGVRRAGRPLPEPLRWRPGWRSPSATVRGMISTDIYGIVRCFLGFFTGVMAEWVHRRGIGLNARRRLG